MIQITDFKVNPTSLVTWDDQQKIEISYACSHVVHLNLRVRTENRILAECTRMAFTCGRGNTAVYLPVQEKCVDAIWELVDNQGKIIGRTEALWIAPREWNLYVMISSHTDIGLHNSQYIQRANSIKFTEKAMELCDKTKDRKECDQYRYVMEGTWFWENYGMDRGSNAAKQVVEEYINSGRIGICSGVAGNCTQVYGLEEMCRSTYEKRKLFDNWKITSETLSMIDMNGLSMGMIQPYADAGYKNIIFAPNQWNPRPSTIWQMDGEKMGATWNTDAGGGGSRIDVRYDSALPMVFYWENDNGNRIFVWTSASYEFGGVEFGLYCRPKALSVEPQKCMEKRMARQLRKLEEKYPYDMWFLACYADDQEPDEELLNEIMIWNRKWKWPRIQTVGNPDTVFRTFRDKYDSQIPVLKGDITGGWWQLPVSTAELLAEKYEIDRMLPTAEKWAVIASLLDAGYEYPEQEFDRAWKHLLFNDEHSYGVSGYQGRRVYETWMQHRDWIEKASAVAFGEAETATRFIASQIPCNEDSVVVFNPTMQHRTEMVRLDDGRYSAAIVPPLGYCVIPEHQFQSKKTIVKQEVPPVVENRFYQITFLENGAIGAILDKEINQQLLRDKYTYGANELLYTRDNHCSFITPNKAEFEITCDESAYVVTVRTEMPALGAEIVQTITLYNHEKRIDLDNQIFHARDMVNTERYNRYLYFAFPFAVESPKRYCHLNGTVAEYAKTVTGHGTDVYMAINEWCCCENQNLGIALMMKDSTLVEFDHIHQDKTDFGNPGDGSEIYVYAANDWLQMHVPGGSYLNYRFRYAITSYKGSFREAGVASIAERFTNPVSTVRISHQSGTLNANTMSFLSSSCDLRLIALKRAYNGEGIIARLYGTDKPVKFYSELPICIDVQRVSVDEGPANKEKENGFITYRLCSNLIIPVRQENNDKNSTPDTPHKIGGEYTGLITKPRAAAGEGSGHLYLLWGQNMEEDFSHYKLYRSEKEDFTADDSTYLTDVFPEQFRVGRYDDQGLKEHTRYYYKVCAVNSKGVRGEMSESFSAITREPLWEYTEIFQQ